MTRLFYVFMIIALAIFQSCAVSNCVDLNKVRRAHPTKTFVFGQKDFDDMKRDDYYQYQEELMEECVMYELHDDTNPDKYIGNVVIVYYKARIFASSPYHVIFKKEYKFAFPTMQDAQDYVNENLF